ncbi:MAG: sulfate adenylyltransferase subunit CysN [Deltaproteobacteria bacterium]|nr:MAG: sulfate adenylyltransferase subunit CysN [Deltaproteobacteria bacterium]
MTRILERSDGSHLAERELIENDIEAFLEANLRKELLRFTTVGSVDDGKSTLIGRLLHDSKGVYDDQLKDATLTSSTGEGVVDFARLTDGLRAEREQGITIDVAYRYFSTPKRKFIIADTPGHVQYTRNMATGASTANVALILIDARLGVLEQSRRHGFIAHLLGIPHLLVCVNKMDLVAYDAEVYHQIVKTFSDFCEELSFRSVQFVPVSALLGTNVVDRAPESTPYYDGPSVLEYLETVEIKGDINLSDFRFPVQYVLRPNLHYRGFAGQIASGIVKVGDEIAVLPSGKTTRITHIDTYDGELEEAFAPMSISLRLSDEIDISRGDLIVPVSAPLLRGRRVDAMLVWMSETSLDPGKTYLLKHMTRLIRTNVASVRWRLDLERLERDASVEGLGLNDIGLVQLDVHSELCFDPYHDNRASGAFILIDSLTNTTVAAGMLQGLTDENEISEARRGSQVSAEERRVRLGHEGGILALGGPNVSDLLKVAWAIERRLFDEGVLAAVTTEPEIARALRAAGLFAVLCGSAEEALNYSISDGEAASDRLDATISAILDRARASGLLA